MRVALVYNPRAGHAGGSLEQLTDLLERSGHTAELLDPKDENLAGRLTQGYDLAVAAGGDGTVTKVAMALADGGPCMAILPLGTANNIATALGVCGRTDTLISSWAAPKRRHINIWTAAGPWGTRRFIEGCGLGALTRAAHHMDDHGISAPSSDQEIAMGRAAMLQSLRNSDPIDADILINGEHLTDRFLLFEMLNFERVGPRLPLATGADPSDGLLDIGYAIEADYNALCAWLSAETEAVPAPLQARRCHELRIKWRNARFRIGDKYWPKTGRPEPDDTFEARITLNSQGPCVLVAPQADSTGPLP